MRNSYNGKNKTGSMEIATDSSFLGRGGSYNIQNRWVYNRMVNAEQNTVIACKSTMC